MAIFRRALASIVAVLAVLASTACHDDSCGCDLLSPDPEGPAVVQIVLDRPSYSVGQTITVHVRIDDAANVASVAFHLQFDKEVIQYVPPAVEGPFLGRDGTETVFLCSESGAGGELIVGTSRLNADPGASGAGRLATFRFQAVNPGSFEFRFTGAGVRDPQARVLPAVFGSVSVVVN